MQSISRRKFFYFAGIGLGSLTLGRSSSANQSKTPNNQHIRFYEGTNLSGWELAVGDATSVCEPSVGPGDIETQHFTDHSEVRANILSRQNLMAHNITFKRFFDNQVLEFVHVCEYKYRLPYLPDVSNTDFNGQTVEGHIALWDGHDSRLLRIVGFQWIVNPHWIHGALQTWTPSGWQHVGTIPLDTDWHTVKLVLDPKLETTSLQIDGKYYPSCFVAEERPKFGSDISAVFAAEAISIDPGEQCLGGMTHKVQFGDWSWAWEPVNACQIFMPTIVK